MTREEAINEIKSWAIPSKKGREVLETLIPELRESKDEKIRLFLIKKFSDLGEIWPEYSSKTIISWLEKQKVQKPIEDVVKDITKNKESAIKFLKSAGIMDDNGELAEIYRSEQKSTDYDHEMWKNCEANFEGGKKEVIDHPEKYGLQKSAEWSERDKIIIEGACNALKIYGHTKLASMLESISPQPKQEWSEGDEILRVRTINRLETLNFHGISGKEIRESIDWLKSLRPQPHWKPSEEQMEALETAERWYSDNMGCNFALVSLCEQLKKL